MDRRATSLKQTTKDEHKDSNDRNPIQEMSVVSPVIKCPTSGNSSLVTQSEDAAPLLGEPQVKELSGCRQKMNYFAVRRL
jgi:hypothetical protein